VDVLEAGLAARVGLGDVLHVIDVLIAGHGALLERVFATAAF
jgi:hypothetical protein